MHRESIPGSDTDLIARSVRHQSQSKIRLQEPHGPDHLEPYTPTPSAQATDLPHPIEVHPGGMCGPASQSNSSYELELEEKKGNVSKKTKTKSLNIHSDVKVYKTYFTAAGGLGFTLVYLLGLVIKQLLSALTSWTLGHINSARPKTSIDQSEEGLPLATNTGNGLQQYFYMDLLSSLLSVIFEFLFNLHMYSGSLRASRILFHELTSTVLRMPLQWLDNTPIGEMLKRFTVDTRMVDIVLGTMSEVADCFVKMIIIVGVGVYTSKCTGFLTLALIYASIQVGLGYINARKAVRRADSQSTADILEYFTSSTTGVSTIRAFGAVDMFAEEMHNRIDKLSTAKRHFWIFNRWLGLQMSLIAILFSTGTGVILLSSKSTIIDASLVGFSLTFSMGVSGALFNGVNSFGQLETRMDAAGAITSYSELETENQGDNEVPEDWPSNGEVEVKSLEVAYSTDLPLVLKDVTFNIGAGQRIGIVGRTGAGKSSLTLALLRLIEPRGGSILIDGIEISMIKLRSLRSKIAFIPQDPILFSGTVRSNLDYFQKVPENKLKEALRRVKLLAEEGDEHSGLFTLDSPISAGGANMSQGQRQLLCLARILIQDPKIVILDEATSAVDNKTDLWIQETIQKEINRTLIVVAHRLRTIVSFDQLIVISDGRIAEIGKPADLFKGKGLFYELVQDSGDKEFLIQTLSD